MAKIPFMTEDGRMMFIDNEGIGRYVTEGSKPLLNTESVDALVSDIYQKVRELSAANPDYEYTAHMDADPLNPLRFVWTIRGTRKTE